MKPKTLKPEPLADVLARLIRASLVGGNATQSAEVSWGGWRVIAWRDSSGTHVTAIPPRRRVGVRRVVAEECRSVRAAASELARQWEGD